MQAIHLDGDGVDGTRLPRTATVTEDPGTGLRQRSPQAGKGDGALFYGADGSNSINDNREYIFTEWGERRERNGPVDRFRQRTRGAQRTAGDDLTTLRSRFDTNGDGKLTRQRTRQLQGAGDQRGWLDLGPDPRGPRHHRIPPDRRHDAHPDCGWLGDH